MSQKSFSDSLRTLPIAHKVVAGCAVAVLAMGGFLFFQWVSTPSYAVLYTELDDQALSEVIDGLEAQGVPYQIESGGSTVMVPRQMVHSARANLASAGVSASVGPQGYELLDNAGLSVSDFRQQVDYKRALEGELAMTLMAMEAVSSADVLLVLPEEALFIEDQEPVTASVLVDTVRPLGVGDIEAITFLVAASVEGLEANAVALAHVNGQVLSAPGDAQGSMAVSNRNIRMVDDFERALATDVEALLDAMYGAATSTPLREQLLEETLNGAGVASDRDRWESTAKRSRSTAMAHTPTDVMSRPPSTASIGSPPAAFCLLPNVIRSHLHSANPSAIRRPPPGAALRAGSRRLPARFLR